jgi:hypothetical protein
MGKSSAPALDDLDDGFNDADAFPSFPGDTDTDFDGPGGGCVLWPREATKRTMSHPPLGAVYAHALLSVGSDATGGGGELLVAAALD